MPSPTNKPLVIYHSGCYDGFAAAFVAWLFFGNDNVELYPATYGEEPPYDLIDGRDVYIVDFSYPLDQMNRILARSRDTIVLDHHKTAQAALEPLLKFHGSNSHGLIHIEFDMERSGAGMAWDYFFRKSVNPELFKQYGGYPWLIAYVQDRDLWHFKLPNSKDINAYISTLPFDFEVWDEESSGSSTEAAEIGKVITRKINKYNKVMVERHLFYVNWFPDHPLDPNPRPITIPVINAPYDGISELLHYVLEFTGAPVAMGFSFHNKGYWQYSLRGNGSVDVSALAKKYGGGGHHNAAGFEAPTLVFQLPHGKLNAR